MPSIKKSPWSIWEVYPETESKTKRLWSAPRSYTVIENGEKKLIAVPKTEKKGIRTSGLCCDKNGCLSIGCRNPGGGNKERAQYVPGKSQSSFGHRKCRNLGRDSSSTLSNRIRCIKKG